MCVSLKAEFRVRKSSPDAEAWHLAARISIVFVCIRNSQGPEIAPFCSPGHDFSTSSHRSHCCNLLVPQCFHIKAGHPVTIHASSNGGVNGLQVVLFSRSLASSDMMKQLRRMRKTQVFSVVWSVIVS